VRAIPQTLLRTMTGPYLFGVHSFDENQPFFIIETDSYETAYRGMLDWERTMQGDLGALFARNPSPKTPVVPIDTPVASTTASSTPSVSDFIQTGFVDRVVENQDARVVLNEQGDLVLLWTFLGRNRIVITTNEYTLREVISRMSSAPVVPTL
jgi:hypothetical protein